MCRSHGIAWFVAHPKEPILLSAGDLLGRTHRICRSVTKFSNTNSREDFLDNTQPRIRELAFLEVLGSVHENLVPTL